MQLPAAIVLHGLSLSLSLSPSLSLSLWVAYGSTGAGIGPGAPLVALISVGRMQSINAQQCAVIVPELPNLTSLLC